VLQSSQEDSVLESTNKRKEKTFVFLHLGDLRSATLCKLTNWMKILLPLHLHQSLLSNT
ncbi:hypothetical protein STEG23_025251, partial [Scotinomys teguina]